MQPRDAARPARRIPFDAAALLILFVLIAAMGWRRWPDLLVDFGQQLYIPWRLSLGERLYSDILFLHGPLSQHLNALLFRLFGASLSVLIAANLVCLASLTVVLHRLIRLASDRVTASLSVLLFLALFAMPQYVMVGNYNFVCPYTHEATHGMVLSAAMLLFLCRWLRDGRTGDAVLAGIGLGLVLATKVDVALAAVATTGAAGLLALALPLPEGRKRRGVMPGIAGAVLPCAAFLIYFLTYLPAGEAFRAAASGFASLSPDLAGNAFYRSVLGLDNFKGNMLLTLQMSGWLLAFVAAAAAADAITYRLARSAAPWAVGLGLALFATLVAWPDLVPWTEMPRALSPAAAILTLLLAIPATRGCFGTSALQADKAIIPMLLLSVFATALLPKIALNVHLFHYGFYLAMPAALALAAACLFWVPRLLRQRGFSGIVFRALSVAVLLAAVVFHLRWSRAIYSLKDLPVGRGGDAIVTFVPSVLDTGPVTQEALSWIEERTPEGSTLVGLPEGIMLNYQARRRTTTPYVNFTMGEVLRFGEEGLLISLKTTPPDYIALVQKKTGEFGLGRFGSDERYGRRIVAWIESHYDGVAQFGGDPLRDEAFGIRVLARRREAP
jgi:dolichyl-phosphate-mannose-protein mannosyltransferase